MLMNQNKFTDYSDCTSPKLFNFSNKSYVKEICFRYYGEAGEKTCEDKKSFCTQCCNHHVGIKFMSELFKCKKICSNVINGIENGKVSKTIMASGDFDLDQSLNSVSPFLELGTKMKNNPPSKKGLNVK